MSLPPATRDISDHPAKGSVTDPVDKNQLHADVDRKLRFYGVIQAFRAGRLPDNTQIDETLRYVADHSPVDLDKLSPAGKQLVSDTKDIIETARLIVKEKNADELFQNFAWHTRKVDYNLAKRDPSESTSITPEKAKADGQEAAHQLRTLLSLLLTNAEARKLFTDFSVIGRDLLARSADFIRPDEEQLRRVNDSVPDHEPKFKERDGETGLPRREEEEVRARLDDAREGVNAVTDNARGLAQDASSSAGINENTNVDQNPTQLAQTIDTDATKVQTKESAKGRFAGLKERIPEQHRERVDHHFERTKNFLKDEYFPKERREQFIYRGKKVIMECQKEKDYQQSISWLLDTLSSYGDQGVKIAGESHSGAKGVWDTPDFKQASNELLALLSRFANNTSTQPILDSVQNLFAAARNDESLRHWFRKVRDWSRKVLLEPGYVLQPQCNNDGIALREEGRQFFDEKYKSQFDSLFDTVSGWFSNLATDPLNDRFGRDWSRLTHDLLFDSEGSLTFKPELWSDIRKVIVPELVDKVGYIPIPRAEFTDENLDLVIENLTLSGRNLFPNIMSVEAHNFMKFSPYSTIHDESHHDFTITLAQIQADIRDVMFYFNKKTGVPKLKDSGIADILLGGEGITTTIHLTGAGKDSSSVFHVKDVHVKLDTLKFSIRDSKHDALYKFLRPLATGVVKKHIQRALQDAIRTAMELIDQQLVKVRDRMEEAKTSENSTRTQALKELFKRQTDEASAKAKEKKEKRTSQFNIVSKRDSLLLPQEGHPHGWANKQNQEDKVALEGRDWRSKAFSIVPTATDGRHADDNGQNTTVPNGGPNGSVPNGHRIADNGPPRL